MSAAKQQQAGTEAEVSGNTLVVSMSNAELPRVWRADLGKFALATLEVREAGGKYALHIQGDGASEDIATYAAKQDAIDAMQAVRAAMNGGKSAKPAKKTGGGKFLKLLKWIGALIALFILLKIAVLFLHNLGGPTSSRELGVKIGVPLPAEQFLGATPKAATPVHPADAGEAPSVPAATAPASSAPASAPEPDATPVPPSATMTPPGLLQPTPSK